MAVFDSPLKNPYVGPRPFKHEERELFFGRDTEAEEILALLVANPVVILYAPSGSGKTSLLNARLIPLLKHEDFQVLPIVRLGGTLPEGIVEEEIANLYVFNTLLNWVTEAKEAKSLVSTTLSEFLQGQPHRRDEADAPCLRIIIFDQFEELFSRHIEHWKDREPFFLQIVEALKNPQLRVLFSLREDYIAQLDHYTPLLPGRLRARFRMELLREAKALMAISAPTQHPKCKRIYEAGVAEKIVDELLKIRTESDQGETIRIKGEFVEPVQLQVVCHNLWERLPDEVTRVTEQHQKDLGDVDFALSNFYEIAVEKAAEESSVHQAAIRNWCENLLITSTNTRGIVHRGPESTGGIPNEVVDSLREMHLIRSEWRAGARWYELTHDRFIRPIQASNEKWSKEREKNANEAFSTLQKAETRFQQNKYDSAMKLAQEALQMAEQIWYPIGVIQSLYCIGRIYETRDNYDEARSNYEMALDWAWQNQEIESALDCMNAIGALLTKAKKYEDAFELYKNVCELAVKSDNVVELVNSMAMIGGVIQETANYDQGIEFFTSCIERQADLAMSVSKLVATQYVSNSYGERASIHLASEDFEAALEDFRQASEIDPYNADWYGGRGDVHAAAGRRKEAVSAYQRAIGLDPEKPFWMLALGDLYASGDQFNEAITEYNKALSLDEENPDTHTKLAHLYANTNQNDKAFSAFKQAIQRNSEDASLPYGLGYAYHREGNYEGARVAFERAIAIDPGNAEAYIGLGYVLEYLKRYYEAIAAYTRAIENDDQNAMAFASLAGCYRRINKEHEYTALVKIAREKSKSMVKDTTYNQACFEALCGNVDEALRLLKKEIEKNEYSRDAARTDIDFEFIRDDPRFAELVK